MHWRVIPPICFTYHSLIRHSAQSSPLPKKTRRQPTFQESNRNAAIKRNPSIPTRRQPKLQAAKREAATKKSPSSNEASAEVAGSEGEHRVQKKSKRGAADVSVSEAVRRNQKKSFLIPPRRQPMLQGSEGGSRGSAIPIPQRGMEKSVYVRVKRVLPEAKLHKREGDAGLRACSQGGIPFPFVRARALFTRTSVFQKESPRSCSRKEAPRTFVFQKRSANTNSQVNLQNFLLQPSYSRRKCLPLHPNKLTHPKRCPRHRRTPSA